MLYGPGSSPAFSHCGLDVIEMSAKIQIMREQEWLNTEEYPFKPRYFETSAGKIHYVDEGKGTPIVFVHGNPSWSFEFRNLISSLSKKCRCIALLAVADEQMQATS